MATKKDCRSCECPTKNTLSVKDCPRIEDGLILRPTGNCISWKPAAMNFTTEQASNFALHYAGLCISRPTLIKWAREKKIGRQIGGKGGKWIIYPEKFKKLLGEDE